MPARKRSRRRTKREMPLFEPPIAIASVNAIVIVRQIPGEIVVEVMLPQRPLQLNPQQQHRNPSKSRPGERLDRGNPEEVMMRPRRKASTNRASGMFVVVPEPVPGESDVLEEIRTRKRVNGVVEVIARTTKARTIAMQTGGWAEIDHQCAAWEMMIVDQCVAEIDLRCATANVVLV